MGSLEPHERDRTGYLRQALRRPENRIAAVIVLGATTVVLAITSVRQTGTIAVDFARLVPGRTSHAITLTGFRYSPEVGWLPRHTRVAQVIFHRRLPRRFTVAVDVWRRTAGPASEIVLRAGGVEHAMPVRATRARHSATFTLQEDTRRLEIAIPSGIRLGMADLTVTRLQGAEE